MIAETLAGIALVKQSVDFIKSQINTAKDIGEITGAVEGLFRGQDEVEKARNKKAGVSVGDQLGIKTVAQEVIDAKLAKEAEAEARRIQRRKQRETEETIRQAMIVGATIVCAVGLLVFLFVAVI
jgi:hypothetical protein